MTGVYSEMSTTSTGDITNAYDFRASDGATSNGNITNRYAYYIGGDLDGSNKYAFYNAGANNVFYTAGNMGIGANGYLNFGITNGSTGYGFRDNSGTMQFKNSGGSWTNFGSGGSGLANVVEDTTPQLGGELEGNGNGVTALTTIGLIEQSSDPSDPAEGESVIWQSDGTGAGDDGDILIKVTAGGVTKTVTLIDFSVA